ncbi:MULTISPECIES: catalase [unclassified Duganella]|uniref:catalase n=1 Tax=unclassified Duganella TaxID=2636909 RepID=UPI000875A1FD|nr:MULTISPECIES: catalase [unclassified Duganella]OEZ63880.1 catalase HPII [Duganella sp. HH105]OFA06967.1 catalase HPII [Duganella sp. HH101]
MAKSMKPGSDVAGAGSILSTVSGPSNAPPPAKLGGPGELEDTLLRKMAGNQALAEQMPFNADKPLEYGEAARQPHQGTRAAPASPVATASTAAEQNASDKLGDTPAAGVNRLNSPLDRVRVDSGNQTLTTNQGVAVANNQDSLKIGLRGPTVLEDFILREKITHFDHERIPERVVHARGSGAHGFFEAYDDLSELTRAALFQQAGKITPVFVRFSTVAGERGSADTARDVRGFAVKFYTDEGIWDLVGNNIPVFFIQDAMKFPDLVHSVKPEPHHAIPQASSAHDTFWDFVSLMPESTHMLMWQMSDRAIPRSYRTMQGFGVHTFRLVNAACESVFCKFHWNPVAGTHSLVWDEAAKIMGADPDFHRRDLWEAIEAGAYPQWELGVQVFSEEQADQFDFDVLDPTKLIPEEIIPVRAIGRITLNRNPDNFFAETEQVAFCTAHIVPGIDFTNDPLLQGRIHSYVDTQISRLGGPNFHEIPINAPVNQVHNNQRDGMHRQAINRGRVNYEPNSLGGGCPFQAGQMGFKSFPERISEDKVRGKPEKFAEHYAQARMFFESQTPVEQAHIANAFRFELSRVQTPAVRARVIANLANVDPMLAAGVADGLGMDMPDATPLASTLPQPAYPLSPALSLLARPGTTGIATRRVAILVGDGVDAAGVQGIYAALRAAGAVPRLVGVQLGARKGADGSRIDVEISLEAGPSVLYDAVIVPDGVEQGRLAVIGQTQEFLRDQYRHCKPIFAWGGGADLLKLANLPSTLPDGSDDPGLVLAAAADTAGAFDKFVAALSGHRAFVRETDPPLV